MSAAITRLLALASSHRIISPTLTEQSRKSVKSQSLPHGPWRQKMPIAGGAQSRD
jgi:hypothetical protein